MLALRGLLRLRNVAVIVAPAGALFLLAHAELGGHAIRTGVAALVVAPAPLAAPELLLRSGRRGDLAGVLVLGTMLISLVLLSARAIVPSAATMTGAEAFVIGSLVANGVPTLRDVVLVPIRATGWIALVVVAAAVIVSAPAIDVTVLIAATAVLLTGVLVAFVGAMLATRDVAAAIGGAGLRDPAVACAIAYLGAGADAAAVPLVYGVFCLVLAAVAFRSR